MGFEKSLKISGFLSAWLSGAGYVQLYCCTYVRILLVVYFEDEILPVVPLLFFFTAFL